MSVSTSLLDDAQAVALFDLKKKKNMDAISVHVFLKDVDIGQKCRLRRRQQLCSY